MTRELSDDEAVALARYLRQKLDDERFPFAPRLDPVKAILAKLDPPAPRPEPLPPLTSYTGPRCPLRIATPGFCAAAGDRDRTAIDIGARGTWETPALTGR